MKNCDEFRPLLSGLIDGELTPEETEKISRHLNRCEECRKEHDLLRQSSSALDNLTFSEPADDVLDRLWKNPFSRFARTSGVLMVVLGYLLLAGYGIYKFVSDPSEEALPRIGVAAMIIGGIVVFASVLRDRLKTYKHDPYKEVKR